MSETATPVDREPVDPEQLVSDLLHAACCRWLERDRAAVLELLGLTISTVVRTAPVEPERGDPR